MIVAVVGHDEKPPISAAKPDGCTVIRCPAGRSGGTATIGGWGTTRIAHWHAGIEFERASIDDSRTGVELRAGIEFRRAGVVCWPSVHVRVVNFFLASVELWEGRASPTTGDNKFYRTQKHQGPL